MRRDLAELSRHRFDVVVVGAGIHGACAAWDAALRGLSVALVDQDDFGGATSANSLRILHGGLRYLSHGDLPRMRESIQERSALLRIAPHLVAPLGFLLPTRRGRGPSRLSLAAGLALNDVASLGRNEGVPADRLIPGGRLLSREACIRLCPALAAPELTGAALWHDVQVRHTERLTLGFVLAAAEAGAHPANYVRADGLIVRGGSVAGIRAIDRISGAPLEVEARVVLAAMGPWTGRVVAAWLDRPAPAAPAHAVAVNVLTTLPASDLAMALQSPASAADDPVCGGGRFIFATPWHGRMLLGTWYAPLGAADHAGALAERGAMALVDEFRRACPAIGVRPETVARVQWGLVPLKAGLERGRRDALADRPRLTDHATTGGPAGLVSLEGVKYTTGRRLAESAVDLACRRLAAEGRRCRTERSRIDGEDRGLAPVTFRDVAALHGRGWREVARWAEADPALARALSPGSTTLGCEVIHAVEKEMALTLADIVLRRTALGIAGTPDPEALVRAAELAAERLGWDADRRRDELAETRRALADTGRAPGAPR